MSMVVLINGVPVVTPYAPNVSDTTTLDLTLAANALSGVIQPVSVDNTHIAAAAAIARNKLAALTVSRALVSDGSGFDAVSVTTAAELAFVNGVTSAIQTQLDAKQARAVIFDESPSPGAATYTKDGVLDFTTYRYYELTITGVLPSASNTMYLLPRLAGSNVAATGNNGAILIADPTPGVSATVASFGGASMIVNSLRISNTANSVTVKFRYNTTRTEVFLSWMGYSTSLGNVRNSSAGTGIISGSAIDGFTLGMTSGNLTSVDKYTLIGFKV